ncbi:N-6 DNA methylase [Companilactobacillus sp.]|uniref:N-6 DNA methylase n=1 Tax=Companilactobacillus sp. TaxID=2767905 RepID=UPI00261E4EEA|nr:N-6 DNA methylase [Companilactobacillus sp.]
MLTNEKIDELLGVGESFEASYKLMDILKDDTARNSTFQKFLQIENDLTFDWFTDYFQEEHSNRKNMKQDFTPDGVVQLANAVLPNAKVNADICAGTGGLTIKRYSQNPNATFYCEEFSDRAIPFLLFNLAIRNVDAYVFHGDSLSRDAKAVYKLKKGKQFSLIEKTDETERFDKIDADTVIMNPPYSLKWEHRPEYLDQLRFKDYDVLAPKSKADFAFLLHGLNDLNETGTMSIVLPHGVLFRGAAEGKIRRKLIYNNYLDAVIGLPEKLFFNTDIPTVILVLKKNRSSSDVLFIDASKQFEKQKNHNEMKPEHIAKVLELISNRQSVDKLAHVACLEEIKENDYNLNIPRFVDTFEPEPVVPLADIMKGIKQVDEEIERNEREFAKMMTNLHGTTPESDKEIKEFSEFFSRRIDKLYGTTTKSKEMEQLDLL